MENNKKESELKVNGSVQLEFFKEYLFPTPVGPAPNIQKIDGLKEVMPEEKETLSHFEEKVKKTNFFTRLFKKS